MTEVLTEGLKEGNGAIGYGTYTHTGITRWMLDR